MNEEQFEALIEYIDVSIELLRTEVDYYHKHHKSSYDVESVKLYKDLKREILKKALVKSK